MKGKSTVVLLFLLIFSLMLTGCDAFAGIFGEKSPESTEYNDELQASTGCWRLSTDAQTYFVFDGSKDVMSFRYIEDGTEKYNGTYRVLHKGVGENVLTPLTFIITRSDKEREDWLGCYTECFLDDFTQFTVMSEEEDLGMIDGSLYTHIYRISELPYKMGTYVLEGKAYQEEASNYSDADSLHIPSGTYLLETGESFTFLMTKPRSRELFQYKNGDTIVEGTFWMAEDKKTIYLYIEHDPYSKVTNSDKAHYDTTFDIYYPPDFYLRGEFDASDGSFVVNGLYHHPSSPTAIEDAVWSFGTYTKA